EIERKKLFSGKALTLYGVGPEDLIRLKLERFRKHDPEDIYAIITAIDFPYEKFVDLVDDAKSYFIGRVEEYLTSAQLVVERMYPEKLSGFSHRYSRFLA
ncbi:MAG TPA: hypothetical protein VFW62_03400, partial [bacterium]|nr:hypothetical protein [bacterium]